MESENENEHQFPTRTSEWSSSIETVIKDIGESCKGYKWMNIFSAKKAMLIVLCIYLFLLDHLLVF